MQKFGLFDLIEKILPSENGNKSSVLDLKTQQSNRIENQQKPTTKPLTKKNFAPLFEFIKRHDEASKRIDKNSKND